MSPVPWTTDATAWCCTNCGFWQRFPTAPAWCPVCLDPRHAPPAAGWDFRTAVELDGTLDVVADEVEPGLWRFATRPHLGIGGVGYLVVRPEGNVAFESPAWWSDAALRQVDALGGVAWAAASHPHTYGALWRLQERFGCEVSVHTADVTWTGAFTVTWPVDDMLDLGAGLALHHTAGHFPGHVVLHAAERRVLFSGDALKLELAAGDDRLAEAISTHKGFLRGIPLSTAEVRRYRDVFAPLDFTQVWTPFEQGRNVGRDDAVELLDHLAATRPTMRPRPLRTPT